jgi:damage-control phosphatase, subfamily I
MKTYIDCIPCFITQSLNAARLATLDEKIHEKVMRGVLSEVSTMDLSQPPPLMGQFIHRIIRRLTGNADPYKRVKDRFNLFALELLPDLLEKVRESSNPFETSSRLAIAGNIIDYGVNSRLDKSTVLNTIEKAITTPVFGDMEAFQAAVSSAKKILYLGDNTGEIVFDRLLIEQLRPERVTYVVRGGPIINDATMIDAENTGMTKIVRVIDNGTDAPGTVLSMCSDNLMKYYNDADLIISKGQGNYETLSEENKNIFFLFKAKCRIAARDAGCELGDIVVLKKDLKKSSALTA